MQVMSVLWKGRGLSSRLAVLQGNSHNSDQSETGLYSGSRIVVWLLGMISHMHLNYLSYYICSAIQATSPGATTSKLCVCFKMIV